LDEVSSKLAEALVKAEREAVTVTTLRANNHDLADRLARKEHELGRTLEELELFATAQAAARAELEPLTRDSRPPAALIAGGRIGTARGRSVSQLRAWLVG